MEDTTLKEWLCYHCGHVEKAESKPTVCNGCDAGDPTSVIKARWLPVFDAK